MLSVWFTGLWGNTNGPDGFNDFPGPFPFNADPMKTSEYFKNLEHDHKLMDQIEKILGDYDGRLAKKKVIQRLIVLLNRKNKTV